MGVPAAGQAGADTAETVADTTVPQPLRVQPPYLWLRAPEEWRRGDAVHGTPKRAIRLEGTVDGGWPAGIAAVWSEETGKFALEEVGYETKFLAFVRPPEPGTTKWITAVAVGKDGGISTRWGHIEVSDSARGPTVFGLRPGRCSGASSRG